MVYIIPILQRKKQTLRDYLSCAKSLRWEVAELGFKSHWLKACAFAYHSIYSPAPPLMLPMTFGILHPLSEPQFSHL